MNKYMQSAFDVANNSPDPSTQTGAVIVTEEGEVILEACNDFPLRKGCSVARAERLERPLKYKFMEHAERNAIFIAAREGVELNGCVMYTTVYPCSDCARAIVQSGIEGIVVPLDHALKDREDWKSEFAISKQILAETGVYVMWLE